MLRVVKGGRLNEDDLVVVGGLQRIRDKMAVKVRPAEGSTLAQGAVATPAASAAPAR